MANIVRQTSEKSKAKVVSITLKNICEEQGISTKGGKVNLPTGSRPLPVQVGTSRDKQQSLKFSHNSLKRLQVQNNFSDRVLL